MNGSQANVLEFIGSDWFFLREKNMLQEIGFSIVGVVPCLMNNAQLSDPLNEYVKAKKVISSKGKKMTDADHMELARLEFMGGLYLENGAPCWPAENIEAMFKQAARMSRKGKDVERGLCCMANATLVYDGPKNAADLWQDETFRHRVAVRQGQVRVQRTRPIFRKWELDFIVSFEDEILNPASVREFAEIAGRYVGLSDWRPRYGRFELK